MTDTDITFAPELQQYLVTYTSYSRGGPGVSLALTKDFRTFERYGVIMPPDDKDTAILPRRIKGYWVLIHRPMTALGAHMWISYSPDLRHWGSHKVMLEARRGGWWDANKIGLCSPPIETRRAGWFSITVSDIQHQEAFIVWDSLCSISINQRFACSVETRGYSGRKPYTSEAGMSAMSCSHADRRLAKTETLFISTTERLTLAWHWLLVASALSSRGLTHIAVQPLHGRSDGNAKFVLAELAPSGTLASPRMSSLYIGPIPR